MEIAENPKIEYAGSSGLIAQHWKNKCMEMEVKYLKIKIELLNANRGLVRLSRFKKKHKFVAKLCKKAYDNGYDEALTNEGQHLI